MLSPPIGLMIVRHLFIRTKLLIRDGEDNMDFQHDLAELSRDLMRKADVEVSTEWDDYYACVKYLELHHRCFDSSKPCLIVCSKELLKKIPYLSQNEQKALDDIIIRLSTCQPIMPYMSKWFKSTEMWKSDFLLKNWDIYHLHLEPAIKGKSFTNPNILFFQRKGQVVHLIDVRRHPKGAEWFDRELLDIIFDNWPWLLQYRQGMRVIGELNDQDVHGMLQNTVAAIPFHCGILLPTTLGVMSSGDSGTAVRYADNVFNKLNQEELNLKVHEDEIRKLIYDSMAIEVKEPLDYTLIIEDEFFVAYETHSNAKIKLFEV